MSQFVAYKTTTVRNKEVLLAALDKLNLKLRERDINDDGIQIAGYDGAHQTVHVRVTKEALINAGASGVYSEVGFRRESDGTYTMVVDHLTQLPVHDSTGASRMYLKNAVEQTYAVISADHALNAILTKTIPEWRAKHKIPATATVRRVTVGSSTKIVLSYATA